MVIWIIRMSGSGKTTIGRESYFFNLAYLDMGRTNVK